jgi:UDP-galactose transporter B1
MARQKQATPLRREVSSEYTSSADRTGTPTKQRRNLGAEIMTSPSPINGDANGKVTAAEVAKPAKQAGLLELVIGVVGIYVSL